MNTLNCADDELILRYQGFVRTIAHTAWKSTLGNVDLEDLISYGQIGLLQAARSYDVASGTDFSTFAFYRVRGAIFDGYASMQWLSRAQYRRICRQQLVDEVIERQEHNSNKGDRSDCANDAAWSAEVVGKLIIVQLALEAADGEYSDRQLADSAAASPSEAMVQSELQAAVRNAVRELPSDERQLISSVYFDGKTLTEAAKQAGKSKSWASRLHDRALQRLLRYFQGTE